jgi:predicted RNA methylase
VTEERILRAAETLLSHLITRNQITTSKLSKAIQAHTNDFQWKDAYEALEIAQIQWLLQYQGEPTITELTHLLDLCPTHTVRSSESVERQQFSTPLPLASVVAQAAQITSSDLVLDPSAGLGILLAFAQRKGCTVVANELAPQRHALLKSIFPAAVVTGVNAEHLEDYLPSTARYSVILMNPPFTSGVHRKQRTQSVTLAHLKSALALLAPGGRLAIVTANNFSGLDRNWRQAWIDLQMRERVTVQFSVGIDGREYRKHGTTIETRLTVIDKVVPIDPTQFGHCIRDPLSVQNLFNAVHAYMPLRLPLPQISAEEVERMNDRQPITHQRQQAPPTRERVVLARPLEDACFGTIVPVQYQVKNNTASAQLLNESIYVPYSSQLIDITGATPHPTPLVESVAMASTMPPVPSYVPYLPKFAIDARGRSARHLFRRLLHC